MRVIAMFRVSTERQANEGASLDAQEREYREIAAREGWHTVAEFRGQESATGASSDRRVLQQVLAAIATHQPDALYAHEQSRLTRGDELEVAMLLRELRERGVKIIVHGVVRDPASIDEGFMIGVQALVDRTESQRIKERMKRGKKQRALEGKKTGGPAPFGYHNPPPGDPQRGTLQVVEDEAVVVRRIFDMSASGTGDRTIGTRLNGSGVASPRGGTWGKTSIRRVLNNPVYIGTAAANVWVKTPGTNGFTLRMDNPDAIVKEGMHEPIIDREVWDKVHARAPSPRTARPRMLTGLLYVNGAKFAGDCLKGVPFYRSGDRSPDHAWLETEETDEAVWDAFASLATEPGFVERLMDAARNPREELLASQEIDYIEGQLARQRRRLDNFADMRADGEINKDEFMQKAGAARGAIEQLEGDLVEQRAKVASFDRTHAERVVKSVQVLLPGRARLTGAQKRAVLRSIVDRIDVTAVRTAKAQERDERGRVLAGRVAVWAIQRIEIRLALPPDAVRPETPTSGPTEEGRGGCLVTTASCLDPLVPARP